MTPRRRFGRTALLIAAGALLLLAGAWTMLTQPVLPGGAIRGSPAVDPSRLEEIVRALSGPLLPRDEGSPESLDRAAAYISRELERGGAAVTEQGYEVGGSTYRNVIAALGPVTVERIVVGAHYDTEGRRPGADDNASGVAGLIEVCRLLGAERLPLRVECAAFTLEEPPHYATPSMGSAVHAASLKGRGVRVRAMLSLEMIGYFTDEPGSQEFPVAALRWLYPTRGNFIAVVGSLGQAGLVRRVKRAMRSASALPVVSINAPRLVPGIDFSDHRSFWEAGYDAVMITDTAFYRNPNYHSHHDTAGTLDYRRMAMVVQGVHAAVLALAR